ncbi:GNAT family N-acetyltransferase [Thalassospira lucentensis]|uniref:GNAT family N-acetyltransferase n=1 Tax=Thalassospira lucentensis TaxID=168935 RepID=UPI003D2F3F19
MNFKTERLILRPRTMDDLDACLAMDKAPGVVDFIIGPWQDPNAHEAFVKRRINQDYGVGLGYWSIFAKQRPDHFIGWILLIPEDGVGPDIEIGWRLHPDHWGKGFAFEAARSLLDHAFAQMELPCIIAAIDPRNEPSKKLAERLGMVCGVSRDGYAFYQMNGDDYQRIWGNGAK